MNDAVIEVRRSSSGDNAFSGWLVRVGDADVALADIDQALALARKLARTGYDTLGVPVRVMIHDGAQSVEVLRIDGPPVAA